MRFFLKHYGKTLRVHRKWALLALLPFVLYLIFAAFDDVTFNISQELSPFSPDSPVAASDSPVATVTLSELIADPDLLFLDAFALMQLKQELGLQDRGAGPSDDNDLRRAVHSTLSLSVTEDPRLRLSYTGKDAKRGRILVTFYTSRLLKRIQEGTARAQVRGMQAPLEVRPSGDLAVVGMRSIWSADRILPATVALLLSALGAMVLIALLEWSDRSFRSERQMARYLGLPVLGTMPDAEPLVLALPEQGQPR